MIYSHTRLCNIQWRQKVKLCNIRQ